MNSVVIFASRHGNTRKVAEVVAAELGKHGTVQLLSSDKAPTTLPKEIDLVVIGGPTEAHGMMVPVAELFGRFSKGTLAGKAATGFDTRLRWPIWLSGSAAAEIVKKLEGAGARVIGPEGSFIVSGKFPVLEPGELERAAVWAASVADAVESKEPATAGL